MYSTSIRNNRCLMQCIAVFNGIHVIKFIVDTGARFTCCNATVFGYDMQEKYLMDKEVKFLGGLVKGVSVKFYKLHLKQFTIGNIDVGERDIWITFDMRVTDTVLGMDILQQVIFTANPYNKRIYFCRDEKDYNSNFQLLTA